MSLWNAYGIPDPVEEHPFAKEIGRKFRFDYAWVGPKIAVEKEGGIWARTRGGHTHPMHILRDMEKGNIAALLGWRVFRFTPEQINKGAAMTFIAPLFHA
jgi:hypothetical protein